MGGRYSCPSEEFESNPGAPLSCVHKCPRENGFELNVKDGVPSCVYIPDKSSMFRLTSAPIIFIEKGIALPIKINDISDETVRNLYQTAKDDYTRESSLVIANIDKDKKLANLFKKMQEAENVRDEAPEAYQAARTNYYTMVKGDAWLNEEKQRIANAEAMPKAAGFVQKYNDMSSRLNQQQKTIELVNGVKDKVVSMRDEFRYTVKTFDKQINDLNNQINIEKKKRIVDNKNWINIIFNVLLVILSLVLIVILIRKLTRKPDYSIQ